MLLLGLLGPLRSKAQADYHVTQFTSSNGLPQNSIRGMAIDDHGFLWLATEGGVARFDGRAFRIYGDSDHPGLSPRRFTHAIRCLDSTVVLFDQMAGIFGLRHGRFTTLRAPSPANADMPGIHGGIPDARILTENSFFMGVASRAYRDNFLGEIGVFPLGQDTLIIVGNQILRCVRSNRSVDTIMRGDFDGATFGLLDGRLIRRDPRGGLQVLDVKRRTFRDLRVIDEAGRTVEGRFEGARLYGASPFATLFIIASGGLYSIDPDRVSGSLVIRHLLDRLPESCKVKSVAYLQEEGVIFLGTDSRGLFAYRRKLFATLGLPLQHRNASNIQYAQAMLGDNTLVSSHGLLVDIGRDSVVGHLPFSPYRFQMAAGPAGELYCMNHDSLNVIMACRSGRQGPTCRLAGKGARASALMRIGADIWFGANGGIGQLRGDTVHWWLRFPFTHKRAINRMTLGSDGKIWLASILQLYRFDTLTRTLDSIPELTGKECRTLELIGKRLFIGTYGQGYYVYVDGRLRKMPAGPNSILSHVHAFVADATGNLWMSTNRGLVRSRLDAIGAYLADTTRMPACYVYREEDGIRNPEFNGGCHPSHLWLPDGRLSLPTMEGLVMFDPSAVLPGFSRDSVVIEAMDIDGRVFGTTALPRVPADHGTVSFTFATTWWGLPDNLDVEYKLDGLQAQYTAARPRQASCTFGHLRPGTYTMIFRKRIGLEPDDIVYSRISFSVAAPWHATTWAYGSYAAGLLALIWSVSSFYARSIRRRNVRLSQMVEAQTGALRQANALLSENVRKLAASEDELRRNLSVRDRLMSIITHDILTPLRFIGLIAKLGSDTQSTAAPGQPGQALVDVRSAIDKLLHSTQNMLNWVKYHREGFRPQRATCSPFSIVDQVADDFREMSRFQGNEIINAVPEDDVIRSDAQLLQVILHNLVSNAMKFTTNGKIVIRSQAGPAAYMLEVSDTGKGMAAEQLDAVRTGALGRMDTPADDLAAGNGIGLSLVAELLDALGGRWTIESPEGKGVIVRIFLPVGQG